ncbi:uncharacterized protein LOC125263289 [Megalobrama amblycephala]|uniref:uncharacterized protein LOC125263289 n=1 Tax=Megalobrama amblycephala TaxID=75352 RepID=UPI00201459E1|nr:uncharacterized protein LOC125263289 [Megalobrama amblycephala]XP_048038250.1 uncharacterized protein LOC125263289 [Megalobrama amblycephala]XP_048038251.1 uncharacterized protein LOC125263289 [Megalobrama amblycephala]XP_048038253.1 uncharacterized protein LOC125263289 [Megalobrama amblycephala]XP_048038254.1 uncharacterized protein LOC125263289 [Megalobrama amblycephala]XP_048038255.1 uncharacterized protein LOC125263289 [Megalobrama amblycephala]XP_048038256.1 uncharacterized protein LO
MFLVNLSVFRHFKSNYRELYSEPMKKMFLKLVLTCFCLWRLDGVFGAILLIPVTVIEGDSVTLNFHLTERIDDEIQWSFEDTLIAEINVTADSFTVYDDVLDGRFRDRLKLDNQTGSLTITNTTTEHAGHYSVRYILANYPMMMTFILTVYGVESVSVNEGDSVTLNSDLTEMKDDDEILWMFGNEETLIAEINVTADRFTVYDDVLDGRFRDRLKLDNQTGSLTITNIKTEHAGDYKLPFKLVIKIFNITVYGEFNIGFTDFIYYSIKVNLEEYHD